MVGEILPPKPPPISVGDDPHPGHGHSQDLRDGGAQRKLRLGGDPNRGLARRVEPRQRGVGLDVGLVHHRHVEAVLEDPVRLGKALFHVAAHDLLVAADVAAAVEIRLRPVFAGVFVEQGRVRRHGFQSRGHRGEHLVVHLDQPRRFLRGLLVHRGHRGDAVAHVADLGAGEIRLVADEPSVADIREVGRGDHRPDARKPLGPLGADGDDARVGVRAQHHLAAEHPASRLDVRAEHRLAGYFFEDLDPRQFLTDDLHDSSAASMTAWMMVP